MLAALRSDRAAAVAVFALALLTRWPLRATVLEEYDSASYALAVLQLDLFHEQPHPPGYILFVGATRLAHLATGDPIAALTAVAALSGAVSAVLLLALLVPGLGRGPALLAVLASLFTGQVWLQQVRPMEDAFAFMVLLAVALLFVRATERGGLGWFAGASAGLGAACGAKQVLPIFLAGLLAWAALAAWRRGGVRWLAVGVGAAVVGSLVWLVPLGVHCGSLRVYLEMAFGQVAWQRENEATAFAMSLARLGRQAEATFVTGVGPPPWAAALWILAAWGAVAAARRRELRFVLWLVLPFLMIRLLLLGLWLRFSLYYLPFVVALAVLGLRDVLISRLPSSRHADAIVAVAVAAWGAAQTAHVLPLMRALHDGPSPSAQAMDAIASRFAPAETLVLTDHSALGRHIAYHARRRGFRRVEEKDLVAGMLQETPHVVKLVGGARSTMSGAWTGSGEAIGAWHLAVPRADELAPVQDFWQVSAFELRGAYVSLRRFRMDEAGRVFAAPDTAVVVFHAPPAGGTLRFEAAARGPVRFVVEQRRTVEWNGRGSVYELPLEPNETADGRVRVDVIPCPAEDCLELRDVTVTGGS